MSGGPRILIDKSPGQARALMMQGDSVIEAWQCQAHAPDLVGSVHRVRIDRLFPAQGRATARLADGTPVSVRVGRRDAMVAGRPATITIMAAPREDKPWQGVTGARLVGRDLVLLPGDSGIAMSRHLQAGLDDGVMTELAACLETAGDFGIILRRAATRDDDLLDACRALIGEWRDRAGSPDATGCLFDGGGLAARIRRQYPAIPIIETGPESWVVFDSAWDGMIAMAGAPQVALAGGGRMWIEPTRALTAIDLDSGDGSFEALFAAAPAAIAAQLRLRQTGGLVVIDLPRMKPATRKQVDADLAAALAADPRHPEWIGRSRAGMLELRLPHGRSGPAGYEADRVASSVLAVLRAIARRPALAAPVIDLSPEMAVWLKGPGAAALALLDRPVTPVVSSGAMTATLREPAR